MGECVIIAWNENVNSFLSFVKGVVLPTASSSSAVVVVVQTLLSYIDLVLIIRQSFS